MADSARRIIKSIDSNSSACYFLIVMRYFLIAYFIFVSVADPFVDGFAVDEPSHNTSIETQDTDEISFLRIAITEASDQHSHNDCPKSCSDHSCHLGHCGFVIPSTSQATVFVNRVTYPELNQYIPMPHVFGLKRPPRTHA